MFSILLLFALELLILKIILYRIHSTLQDDLNVVKIELENSTTKLKHGAVGSASDLTYCQVWVRITLKVPVVSLCKRLSYHCVVLVSSRNGFEHDFRIELKQIEGRMED